MFGLSDKIVNQIKIITNKYHDNFVIFGSRARNDYKANSDIDIAVMNRVENNVKYKIMDDFDKLNIAYKIDLVFTQDVENKKFLDNIKKDGIQI